MIQTTCPECSASLQSPDSLEGKKETCPECGKTFIVPQQKLAAMVPITSGDLKTIAKDARTRWLVLGWLLIAIGVFGFFIVRHADYQHAISRVMSNDYAPDLAWKMDIAFELLFVILTIITGITILHRESILARQIKGDGE